jgi:formylglycine-generating enzyme required for sulfatase activity
MFDACPEIDRAEIFLRCPWFAVTLPFSLGSTASKNEFSKGCGLFWKRNFEMKTLGRMGVLLGVLLLTHPSVWAIDYAFVPVGNANNEPDTRTGYGKVDHDYAIGKYDVTAGQYCEFLNAVATESDPYGLYNPKMEVTNQAVFGCNILRSFADGKYSYSVAGDWAKRPVNYVSWGDAARFCNWMQTGDTENGAYTLNGAITDETLMAVTRNLNAKYCLPTLNEWYKAAYYDPNKNGQGNPGYWLYPTKSDTPPSNVFSETEPNHANFFDYGNLGTHGYTIGDPYYRTEVGTFKASSSAYGTYDMAGNVGNWTESDGQNILTRDFEGTTFMTGSFSMQANDWNNSASPIQEDIGTCLRVVIVPEPGTIIYCIFCSIIGMIAIYKFISK